MIKKQTKPLPKKLYGLFLEKKDGKLNGYVELSFSMGWSPNRVRVWNKLAHVKEYLKHYINDDDGFPKDEDVKYFIARLNSKKSGIKIDWDPKSEDKYVWRNAAFKKI